MTQSIRDAAQALLDAMNGCASTYRSHDAILAEMAAIENLRVALSAPQPTADERVAEHMRLVDECGKRRQEWHEYRLKADRLEYDAARKAVEQSARALLSASQWCTDRHERLLELVLRMELCREQLDLAYLNANLSEAISIAKAMSAKETK